MEELTEEELAEKRAKEFVVGMRTFKNLVKSVDRKGSLERVLTAGVEFPLAKGYPRFLNEKERLLFGLIVELTNLKIEVLGDLAKRNKKGILEDDTEEK